MLYYTPARYPTKAVPCQNSRAGSPVSRSRRSLPPGGISWQGDGRPVREIAVNVSDIIVLLAAATALGGLGWFFFGPRRARFAQLVGGGQRVVVSVTGGFIPDLIIVQLSVQLSRV